MLDDSSESQESIAEQLKRQIGDWTQFGDSAELAEARPLRKILGKNCLFWGLATSQVIHQPLIARLIQLKAKPAKSDPKFDFEEAVKLWCDADQGISYGQLLQGVAWAHALPRLTKHVSKATWLQLLESLLEAHEVGTVVGPAARFLTDVEIPLAIAHSLTRLPLCKALRKPARERFEALLEELLDGEGTPHAQHVDEIQQLLAVCVRCLVLDAEAKKGRISKSARSQFDWLTRQTLRWSRPNGSGVLLDASDSPFFDDLMLQAFALAEDESDVVAWKCLRGRRVTAADQEIAPESSEHSEWSEVATMKCSWDAHSPWLATTYDNQAFAMELGNAGTTILSGPTTCKVFVDGELLEQDSDWVEVCWESGLGLDYLELECTLNGDWKLQRQLLLARDDLFMFFADAIVGPRSAEIRYQHTLPLSDQIVIEQAAENTEATILGDRRLGRIVPLSLPEWKSAQGADRLRVDPFRLELTSSGSAIYAPLFVCLDPARRDKPLTWRQLTVAEDLLAVTRDEAVAYRVQIGRKQWVFYRSVSKPGNRTFLGLNLISDFYAARFRSDGETQMLIDVEADAET